MKIIKPILFSREASMNIAFLTDLITMPLQPGFLDLPLARKTSQRVISSGWDTFGGIGTVGRLRSLNLLKQASLSSFHATLNNQSFGLLKMQQNMEWG